MTGDTLSEYESTPSKLKSCFYHSGVETGGREFNYIFTPRNFIIAKLSVRKPGSSSVLIICVTTKFKIYFFTMQTFKEIIQLAKQSSEVRFPVWTESECHQKKKIVLHIRKTIVK